jgi:DNA-binding transcriptional LysR family regulator
MPALPDFEGLAMFAKVAEEGSFAAAARALGVSVATVSRAVSRLEQRIGARLLNRSSRQMALTGFGISIAESAAKMLAEAEETEGKAREMAASPRGLVRFAVPMSFGLRWVGPLLPAFYAQYPEVKIDLHLSDSTVDLIGQGFDAALRISALPDSSLVARRLCPVSQILLAAPAYLDQYGVPVHPAELNPSACLGYAYRSRSEAWRFENADGEEFTLRPDGRLRVTNADALLPTLLAGLGIAELPEFIAADYVRDGRLVRLLPDWWMMQGGLYFLTPSMRARPAKVQVLSDFFAQHLSQPDWQLVDRAR